MLLHRFYTPGLAINTYLIGDASTERAVIVDPTRDVDQYIHFAHQRELEISDIIETHVHADFVSGSKELKSKLKGGPVIHCSAMGGTEWTARYADKLVKDGDEIIFGEVILRSLHTPGHTPEHLMWLCYDGALCRQTPCLAFTGDFLFVGSVGRPDLIGEEFRSFLVSELYHSLFVKLNRFPDFLEIFPGHGKGSMCGKALGERPSSTLGYERLFNPFFEIGPLERWGEILQRNMPTAPMNFARIKKINLEGPPLLSEFTEVSKETLVLDLRQPELFAKSHIQGSLNIPFTNNFCNWVCAVLEDKFSIVLVAENPQQCQEAVKSLQLIGFDHLAKSLLWNEQLANQYSIDTLSMIDVEALSKKLDKNEPGFFLLDVRTSLERDKAHVEGSNLIELTQLPCQISQLSKEADIHVICESGSRASIAASLLKKRGFARVSNVLGGMAAWKNAGLPIKK